MNYSRQKVEYLGLINVILDPQGFIKDLSAQASDVFRVEVGMDMLTECGLEFIDDNYQPYPFAAKVRLLLEQKALGESAFSGDSEFECGISYPDRNVVW